MKNILLLLSLIFSISLFAKDIVIAENGKALAGILVPENAKPIVTFAAKQLKQHLDEMTGANFEITTKPSAPVNFYLGFGNAEDLERDTFVLSAKDSRIDIYGKDSDRPVGMFDYYYDNPDKGTLVGVFYLLDTFGIRWPVPGQENAYIPKKASLSIPEQELKYVPPFSERRLALGWDFLRTFEDGKEYANTVDEVYLWGLRNHASVRGIIDGCHTEHSLKFQENEERLKHPSMFQTKKDGTQDKNYSCWTDPGTTQLWIKAVDAYFGGVHPHKAGFMVPSYLRSQWPCPFINPDEFMIDPMDHYTGNDGRCYCQRCEEFRRQYPCEDDSEIIWKVMAEVADFTAKKYPGKIISTLVYPPKKQYPKYTKMPENVRIRLCIMGARYTNMPVLGKIEAEHLKTWNKAMNGLRFPLWTYQCAVHGRALVGVPDTYPHLHDTFLKKIRPWSSGTFLEQHSQSFMMQAVDAYIFLRLAWNQNLDVDKELAEYYRMMYGPAAREAQDFFARLEANWLKVEKLITRDVADDKSIGLSGDKALENQKKVWQGVYTLDEIAALDKMLAAMSAKCQAGTIYAKHCDMVQKYILGIMKAERSELMEKEDRRAVLKFVASRNKEKAQVYTMLPSDRRADKLEANAKFIASWNDEYFVINAEMEEPYIAQTQTLPARKNGDVEIWTDNCVELFFYSVKSDKYWHIIVNDQGNWVAGTKGRVLPKWGDMPGLKVKAQKLEKSWKVAVKVPLSQLEINGGELRFNFCRERHINGQKEECSSWSPLGLLGNWNMPDNYPTVTFEK